MSKLFMLNTVNTKSEEETTMSNEIQKFTNEKFNWNIRVILIDGKPWFIGVEIARRLGYKDARSAVYDRVFKEYKLRGQITYAGQERTVTLINEAGVYQLIFSSKLETAQIFQRWVFEEVLPSIRKHGVYATEDFIEKSIADPAWAIGILTALKKEQEKNKQLTKENEIMQPKAKYYDEVLDSSSLITVTSIAKQYGLSGQGLNRLLYAWEVQYPQGDIWVLYQEYADKGYAYYEEYPYVDSDGVQQTHQLLKWTQKGKEFIHNILKSHGYIKKC